MNLEPHMPCHVLGDKELGRFRRRMAARTGKQLSHHALSAQSTQLGMDCGNESSCF